jgi:hypothetical protein
MKVGKVRQGSQNELISAIERYHQEHSLSNQEAQSHLTAEQQAFRTQEQLLLRNRDKLSSPAAVLTARKETNGKDALTSTIFHRNIGLFETTEVNKLSFFEANSFRKSVSFSDVTRLSLVSSQIDQEVPQSQENERHCQLDVAMARLLLLYLKRIYAVLIGLQCRIPKLIIYYASSSSLGRHANLSSRSQRSKKSNRSDVIGGQQLGIKCMLMSNFPMPDFHVQWSDGTRLKYQLADGYCTIIHKINEKSVAMIDQSGAGPGSAGGVLPGIGEVLQWEGKFNLHGSLVPTAGGSSMPARENRASSNVSIGSVPSLSPSMVSDDIASLPELLKPYLLESQIALVKCLKEERKSNSVNSDGLNPTNFGRTDEIQPVVIVEN